LERLKAMNCLRRINFIITITLFCLLINTSFSQSFKEGFISKVIVNTLVSPTSLDIAPDGRIFITEKSGRLRIVENGILLDQPALEVNVDEFGEQGLSSLILDPEFDSNGLLYLYYNSEGENRNIIERYTINGNLAIPGSGEVILILDELESTIHNGGTMRFASDGSLFVSTGEGGRSIESQDFTSRLGKMLRINKDGTIPTDNPFYDVLEGDNRAIYAYGLRNPFSYDIDPLSGRIFLNDVGEFTWEEVNEILPGKNYGWFEVEGPIGDQTPPDENYQDPFFAYDHTVGCAVVGAAFYNPINTVWPDEFKNTYLFGDFCNGNINVLDINTGLVLDTLARFTGGPTGMRIDRQTGKLFYLSFGNGELIELDFTGDGSPVISREPESLIRIIGEEAGFNVEAFGNELQYQWFINDEEIIGENNEILVISNVQLDQDESKIQCKIFNDLDTVFSKEVLLQVVDNNRPEITITSPSPDYLYKGGDTLRFAGNATDLEDGNLSLDKIAWKIDFYHDDHAHPVISFLTNTDSSFIVLPKIGELDTNVFYRIQLTAIDEEGLVNSEFVDIHPLLTNLNITSIPSNRRINVDGTVISTPAIVRGVVGMTRTLLVDEFIIDDDSVINFSEWENRSNENLLEFDLEVNSEVKALFDFTSSWVEGDGEGLNAKYFTGLDIESVPDFERIDSQIDFNWDWGSPGGGLPNDNFSISWSGEILSPVTGEYTFYIIANDYARLRIGNKIIFDNWQNSNVVSEDSVTIELISGERQYIQLDFADENWQTEISLGWKHPFNSREIIPQRFLYTDIISGIPELFFDESFFVFPTSVENELTIVLGNDTNSYSLSIHDQLGLEVWREERTNGNTVVTDVSNLEAGTYTVRIKSDDTIRSTRFFKLN